MTKSLYAVIKPATVALAALLLIGLTSLSAAQAVPSTSKPPPNPCKSFTAKSLDALFAIPHGSHVSTKLTKFGTGKNEALICTVRHHKLKLIVTTERTSGGFGGPFKCYKRPRLGKDGIVCVSDIKSFPASFARFLRHGVYFNDDYNVTLPDKGARLYAFALAQYKAYKG